MKKRFLSIVLILSIILSFNTIISFAGTLEEDDVINENNIELNQRIRVIDTLPLARRHFETPNHKLITLKDYLNLDNNSHDALEDCLVTNKVYQYIKHENNKIVQVSN